MQHVLVEKPVGANLADAKEMVAATVRSGVHFMDG